jgi:hypothetical protein
LQKILREIEELEATSSRVGGLKPEDALTSDEMAKIIKAMEEAQRKADRKERRARGEESEEEEEEEKDEKKEEEGEEEEGQVIATQASPLPTSSSDTFITQNQPPGATAEPTQQG